MQIDVAIIGAGPIGIFSAFQAGMLGMKSCIVDALDIQIDEVIGLHALAFDLLTDCRIAE